MLKGLSPNTGYFEACWEHARKQIEGKPDFCIVPDLESGLPIIMTNQERQGLIDAFESCKPTQLINKPLGKIILFGTGGELNNAGKTFEDLFLKED